MPKGTYSLIIILDKEQEIKIGKLGSYFFKKGYYVYNGSALGGYGRVKYHLKKDKKKRWHIDYLLEKAKIINVLIAEVKENMEHQISNKLFLQKGAEINVPGFGSSDCNRCKAHLIYFNETPNVEEVYKTLNLDYIVLNESNFKDI